MGSGGHTATSASWPRPKEMIARNGRGSVKNHSAIAKSLKGATLLFWVHRGMDGKGETGGRAEWSGRKKRKMIYESSEAERPTDLKSLSARARSFKGGKYLPIWLIAAHSNATESLLEAARSPVLVSSLLGCEFTQPGTKLFLSDSVLLLRWREMPVCLRSYRGMSQFTLVEINPIGLGRGRERGRRPRPHGKA